MLRFWQRRKISKGPAKGPALLRVAKSQGKRCTSSSKPDPTRCHTEAAAISARTGYRNIPPFGLRAEVTGLSCASFCAPPLRKRAWPENRTAQRQRCTSKILARKLDLFVINQAHSNHGRSPARKTELVLLGAKEAHQKHDRNTGAKVTTFQRQRSTHGATSTSRFLPRL